MRQIALGSTLGQARDFGASRGEQCRLTPSRDPAVRTNSPSFLRSCPFRSSGLFPLPSETSAQARRILLSAQSNSLNMLVRGCSVPIEGEACGGWGITAGHFLLADAAPCPVSARSHYDNRPFAIERRMKRSAHLSSSETEAGYAGEQSRRTRNRIPTGIPPGRASTSAPPFEKMTRARSWLKQFKVPAVTGRGLATKRRCPVHAEPRRSHRPRKHKEHENECSAS